MSRGFHQQHSVCHPGEIPVPEFEPLRGQGFADRCRAEQESLLRRLHHDGLKGRRVHPVQRRGAEHHGGACRIRERSPETCGLNPLHHGGEKRESHFFQRRSEFISVPLSLGGRVTRPQNGKQPSSEQLPVPESVKHERRASGFKEPAGKILIRDGDYEGTGGPPKPVLRLLDHLSLLILGT